MTITTQAFIAVNVGTAANDGTGDELRSAFIKLNSNFSNISTSGFNAGNILASGNVQAVYFVGDGSQLTNISAANAYGNGNVATYLTVYNGVVSASNVFVAGNVTAQWLVGRANLTSILTQDLGASGMIYANAGTQSTSTGTGALVVNGGMGVTGNLTVGNLTVLGNITTVNSTTLTVTNNFIRLSNDNITNTLDIGFVGQYAAGQGNVYTGLAYRAADGIYRLFSNLTPSPSTTIDTANVTPASLQLGNILAANIIGTIITPAQGYITSVGNLANIRTSGNITTTGYFFGNGSQLAGLVSYSNVYVATYLPTYSGSVANLTVTATLAGPTITAINSNVTVGNTNMKNYVDGQISAANSAVTSANLGMKGYVDNSVSTANIGMKGYVDSVASLSIYGNSNVKSYLTQFDGNLISNGNIAYNIGTNTNQWATVYANVIYATSNIFIGGTDLKSYIDGVATLSIYSNVNTKAYTESMGFTNYSNINVAAYISAQGITSYSNVQVATYLPTYTGNIQAGNVKVTSAYRFASGAVTITNGDSHVELSPDTGTNALAGVKVGGNGYILGPNASRNITLNYGSASGVVGMQSNVVIGTGGSGNLTVIGGITAGNITGNVNGFSIGYLDVPQNNQGTNDYVLTTGDRGKHVLVTNSNVANIYIPTNSGVNWNVGTSIIIVNNGTGNANIIANSGVTLYLAGSSTTNSNSRILTSHGIATLLNTTANVWYVSGTGVN